MLTVCALATPPCAIISHPMLVQEWRHHDCFCNRAAGVLPASLHAHTAARSWSASDRNHDGGVRHRWGERQISFRKFLVNRAQPSRLWFMGLIQGFCLCSSFLCCLIMRVRSILLEPSKGMPAAWSSALGGWVIAPLQAFKEPNRQGRFTALLPLHCQVLPLMRSRISEGLVLYHVSR